MDRSAGLKPRRAADARVPRAALACLLAASAVLAGCAAPGALPTAPVAGHAQDDGDGAPPGGNATAAPADAAALHALCGPADAPSALACVTAQLKAVLAARGANASFDMLEALAVLDPAVNRESHPLAHDLGRHALVVYGAIGRTLAACSLKAFQGCIHGALQAHFESLPELDARAMEGICPAEATFFQYVCLHGLGHGLVLATRYDINRSLGLCDAFPGSYAQESCYGGVFMQNFVGYTGHLAGQHRGHHGEGGQLLFMLRQDDLAYPCSALGARYQQGCWLFQTSVALHFNGGDFANATEVCATRPPAEHRATCFRSLGRDAGSYTGRSAAGASAQCARAPEAAWRAACVKGFIAEAVLNFHSPSAGLPLCRAVPEADKAPCYEELAAQGRGIVGDDAIAAVCAEAEEGYEAACRRGAGLA